MERHRCYRRRFQGPGARALKVFHTFPADSTGPALIPFTPTNKGARSQWCVVENYALLARVIRVEADVKHSLAKPKTVDEALAELESKVGAKGRRKFEKFLREVAEDEGKDVVDVEFEIRLAA